MVHESGTRHGILEAQVFKAILKRDMDLHRCKSDSLILGHLALEEHQLRAAVFI